MRILHVIGDLRMGGAEKLLVDLLPILRTKVENIEVVVFRHIDTPLEHQLQAEGITVHYLSEHNVYHPIHIVRLRKIAKDFDIVHAHNMPPQLYVPLALLGTKAKLITTEHTTTSRHRVWWFRPIEQWMYRCYSHVICISEATQHSMQCVAGRKVSSSIVENGINTKYYSGAQPVNRASIGTPEGRYIITMVGRLSYQKDQATIIRALSIIEKDVELWLVGEGEERENLENITHELKLTDRVHFLGTRTDIPALLAASDIVIQSSHIEGFGLAAVEGMASGKPVVASRVPGLESVVAGAGILFEHGNASELADIVTQLLNDRTMYQQTASACLIRAQRFDIRNTANAYVETYTGILRQS